MKKLFIFIVCLIFFTSATVLIHADGIKDQEFEIAAFAIPNLGTNSITSYNTDVIDGEHSLTLSYSKVETVFDGITSWVEVNEDSIVSFIVPIYVTHIKINCAYGVAGEKISINNVNYTTSSNLTIDTTLEKTMLIKLGSHSDSDDYVKVYSISFYAKASEYKTTGSLRILSSGDTITSKALRYGATIAKEVYDALVADGYTFGVKLSYTDGVKTYSKYCPCDSSFVAKMDDSGDENETNTYYQFYCVLVLTSHFDRTYTGSVYMRKGDSYIFLDSYANSFNALVNEYYNDGKYLSILSMVDRDKIRILKEGI